MATALCLSRSVSLSLAFTHTHTYTHTHTAAHPSRGIFATCGEDVATSHSRFMKVYIHIRRTFCCDCCCDVPQPQYSVVATCIWTYVYIYGALFVATSHSRFMKVYIHIRRTFCCDCCCDVPQPQYSVVATCIWTYVYIYGALFVATSHSRNTSPHVAKMPRDGCAAAVCVCMCVCRHMWRRRCIAAVGRRNKKCLVP